RGQFHVVDQLIRAVGEVFGDFRRGQQTGVNAEFVVGRREERIRELRTSEPVVGIVDTAQRQRHRGVLPATHAVDVQLGGIIQVIVDDYDVREREVGDGVRGRRRDVAE